MDGNLIGTQIQSFVDVLIAAGKLSQADFNKVLRVRHGAPNDSIPKLLYKLGYCSESDIADAACAISGYPRITNFNQSTVASFPDQLPVRFLKEQHICPLDTDEHTIKVAVFNPFDDFSLKALALATHSQLDVSIATFGEIEATLEQQYGDGKSKMDIIVDALEVDETAHADDIEHLKNMASEAPIIKVVNFIFNKAIESGASDVHIEPFEEKLQIRLRIDGVLNDIDSPPVTSSSAVISRIKIMAKLDIAERRLPQDGRIKLQMVGKELDLRVSTIPTFHGESIVIRLLDKENVQFDFAHLGFAGQQAERFINLLDKPNGIFPWPIY